MSLLPMQIRIEEDDGSARTLDVVDLYDLALIMTYERYTIEPRFRHTQLYDYASNRNDFSVLRIAAGNDWYNPAKINKRIGFFFQPEPDAPHHESERDLPSKMLPWNIADGPPLLKSLTPTELDTIFWQARAHDSCYASIALLQFLFKLFSPDQPLRIRTGDGTEFISLIRQMHTARYDIFDLRQMIFSIVKRDQEQSEGGYYTGESEQMPHCVAAFPPWVAIRGRGQVERTILDLSSLQFGDAGRGLKGHKSLFVFESITKFEERMKSLSESGRADGPVFGGEMLPRPEQEWLEDVAKRVKKRYDEHQNGARWCGHCGAPESITTDSPTPLRACTACKSAWYCDAAHQSSAWPYHKHWCKKQG